MAKDKSELDASAKKEKKEKKDKKRKSSEAFEAAEEAPVKKEKKSKKDRKSATTAEIAAVQAVEVDGDGDVIVKDEDEEVKKAGGAEVPRVALVPFANPLCDEKNQKKVLKSVKKAAKNKALKRGVKECVKSIRKSPSANPSTINSTTHLPPGIVILAADISPMDVISHIPVLCEDHNIPYLYVPSRAELGAAGSTKRPTSVVMITPNAGKGAKAEGEEKEDGKTWEETFGELHKLALKLGQVVRV